MEQNSGSWPGVLCILVFNRFDGNSAQVNQFKDRRPINPLPKTYENLSLWSVIFVLISNHKKPNDVLGNVNAGKIIQLFHLPKNVLYLDKCFPWED